MPYIGNTAANRFVASKSASVFSGDGSTTAFTLDHGVGSDEDILVSVDGVIQEPSVAYSVSGTTLTFTAAPSSNSGNNIFVYYLFRTVGTVSHPSSNALEATSGTFTGNIVIPDGGNIGSASDTDAMSISSGGVVTFSQTPVGAFISEADQWRLTAGIFADVNPIASNLERVDDASFSKIGTGMSVSSGIWSFPSTGLYLIRVVGLGEAILNDNIEIDVYATIDNSSYDLVAVTLGSGDAGTGSTSCVAETYVNVTNTSNVKVKFGASSISSGSAFSGITSYNLTHFTFIKLGESQ